MTAEIKRLTSRPVHTRGTALKQPMLPQKRKPDASLPAGCASLDDEMPIAGPHVHHKRVQGEAREVFVEVLHVYGVEV